MIEINWQRDYHGEFTCPKCSYLSLKIKGNYRESKKFFCSRCQSTIISSVQLSSRSRYLESRMKDEYIDWERDYHGEFICPECDAPGISARGIRKKSGKRHFGCPACKKKQEESCEISIIKIEDPLNMGVNWYTNHRIEGFICPKCQAEDIYLTGIRFGKKRFQCKSCKHRQLDSLILNNVNVSHYSNNTNLAIKSFDWKDEQWDLRTINPNFDDRDRGIHLANFANIHPIWFKVEVKKYVKHLCKTGRSLSTIQQDLSTFRRFSRYLVKENTSSFDEINRSLILDYLVQGQKINKLKLSGLRKLFTIGTTKGWFNIDQDIIRDADYPKQYQYNPDPISDRVREQIEQNLHLLPDPIARMWLIGYFSAMRPSELALLKRDCLVQEGQHWKLIWHRKKTNDYHEIPISRTIAQLVQEQQEYIQNLWGDKWKYLFCHYHNLSHTDVSQSQLEPVRKVLPIHVNHPLSVGIRTLITVLDIRDENGLLAKFQSKLLRSTRLTELFAQGHDLAVVSAWAGHKQFATTATHYTEVSCNLMEKEAGHIQKALVNSNGHRILYESFPKSFWESPISHKLELTQTHVNTPIYGYCGLPLNQDCDKSRACYTCECFVATIEKLPQYINTLNELQAKLVKAISAGQEVLVEQFCRQAEQLDKIIASLQQEAA